MISIVRDTKDHLVQSAIQRGDKFRSGCLSPQGHGFHSLSGQPVFDNFNCGRYFLLQGLIRNSVRTEVFAPHPFDGHL